MTRVLFWNIGGRPLDDLLRRALLERECDVLVLAEAAASNVVPTNQHERMLKEDPPDLPAGVRVIYAEDAADVRLLRHADDRRRFFALTPRGASPVLLAVAHLRSKLHAETEDQNFAVRRFVRDLLDVQREHGVPDTVIVGDLNFDPYEVPALSADGLHGRMRASDVRPEGRTVQGTVYKQLYSPMWSLFGDRTPGPPGTYFHASGGAASPSWHMFDQVLVGGAAVGRLGHVEIVPELCGQPLGGADERPTVSDHYPIRFRLDP